MMKLLGRTIGMLICLLLVACSPWSGANVQPLQGAPLSSSNGQLQRVRYDPSPGSTNPPFVVSRPIDRTDAVAPPVARPFEPSERPAPKPAPVQPPAPLPPTGVGQARPAGVTQVPVLLYHDVVPEAGTENGAVVSTAEFAQQMGWLQEQGYTAITTAELAAWMDRVAQLPPRPVLITFDDGYVSNYSHAFPILQQHGMKATVFTISGHMGRQMGDLRYMDSAQMQEMAASGVIEFGGHTHDGHRRVRDRPVLTAWTADERMADLRLVMDAFVTADLAPPTAFAYPYGAYDEPVIQSLKAAGYSLAFTVKSGYVRQGDDRFQLKRLVVFPGFTECDFAGLVTGRPCGS